MSLNRYLVNHEHVHSLVVTLELDGWEVREEEDATVLSIIHREDWHQVERDLYLFELRSRALKRAGWIET